MHDNRSMIDGALPVRESFLPLSRPAIGQEEQGEVLDTLRSDWLSRGPKTQQFEALLRNYIGCKHILAVSSCTSALHLALVANGIGESDEVITCPQTFVASANVILRERATPVFVDCDRRTFNIDVGQIEAKITSSTRAIIPIHMAGQPCDLDEIHEIARRHNLVVIEDAAHAIGAIYKGRRIGSWGHHAAFSFYASKNMTTGDGGSVTSLSEDMDAKLRMLSIHGMSTDAWRRYAKEGKAQWHLVCPGFKYNMTDLAAAVGIHQLAKLERFIARREHIAGCYDEAFREIPEIGIPYQAPDRRHAWHLYVMTLDVDALGITRDQFIELLKAENIGTGIHFISVHLQPYYQERFGFKNEDFPNALWLSQRVASLPLFPAMTDEDVSDVISAVRKVVSYCREQKD